VQWKLNNNLLAIPKGRLSTKDNILAETGFYVYIERKIKKVKRQRRENSLRILFREAEIDKGIYVPDENEHICSRKHLPDKIAYMVQSILKPSPALRVFLFSLLLLAADHAFCNPNTVLFVLSACMQPLKSSASVF